MDICPGHAVQGADDGIVKWDWDFGGKGRFVRGGSTATHAYTSAGTYYAELLVTDRYGANATA